MVYFFFTLNAMIFKLLKLGLFGISIRNTDFSLVAQSAFFVVRGEDLPRATFAKTIESIVQPLFSPAHFPAQGTSSAVWLVACLPAIFN